ncbi:predicted protein [Sclerotinia sclerotiorum 1980 UF-70]|uniref:Uncharacterized protein n=1 Tax=Sclerotinia sclerotiorum (strain ATCC 18683 / 1980 / Ss-1) TaxID=665079 RepID=A7E7W2_SCLS1|nr:predicted protein [Sclerotinia sclerotiorum 1980 UF-70]EDN96464.1 predicted protein [Sclerotinia sclerotiorum 1980 UF-70]
MDTAMTLQSCVMATFISQCHCLSRRFDKTATTSVHCESLHRQKGYVLQDVKADSQ